MIDGNVPEGLTFDDVLLLPGKSSVLPAQTDTRTCLSRKIAINIPIVAAAMDTVTDARLAIAIARQGGIGFVHRNMTIDRQAEEVDRVKRSESGMIVDPVTISPELTVRQALDIMNKYKVSGLPVTRGQRLVGILTNRDLRFERNLDQPVGNIMTKDNLVTVAVGTTLEEAERILQRHRIEKLLVVDKDFNLKGLITVKDIQKKLEFPNAAKDEQGRLRVGAAIGATGDFLERAEEMAREKVDVIAIDTAHGHTTRVMDAIKAVKHRLPDMQLIAGNVATAEATRDLIALGVDALKVGIGPGSICTTRVVTGAGVPQITAIAECVARRARQRRPDDRRRRHQVFRRHHEGDCRRRSGRDDRQSLCRHRGIARRDDSLPGPHLQVLSRHGISRRDGGWLRRPLRAGRRRARQVRSGRDRGAGAVQRAAFGSRRTARRRAAQRHGILRRRKSQGTAGAGQVHPHLRGRLARKPRSRRDHHARSSQLSSGIDDPAQPRAAIKGA